MRRASRDAPGLFSLVDDTMGYRGKVDWRYRSTNAR